VPRRFEIWHCGESVCFRGEGCRQPKVFEIWHTWNAGENVLFNDDGGDHGDGDDDRDGGGEAPRKRQFLEQGMQEHMMVVVEEGRVDRKEHRKVEVVGRKEHIVEEEDISLVSRLVL
jgi:hypothetical protein